MANVTIIAPTAIEAPAKDQDPRSGLAAGANALQKAGLRERLAAVGVTVDRIVEPGMPAGRVPRDRIDALGLFNGSIAGIVRESIARDSMPVLAGGTCSHLPGMLGGLQQALPPETRLGLLWLDAHGDFNTPTTTLTGRLGGMPVAVAAGLCHAQWREGAGMTAPIPTNRIMMVDVRNLDPAEEALIRATDVRIVKAQDTEALARIAGFAASVDALYIHIDADILDISLQPNHPTAEPGGLDAAQTLSLAGAAIDAGEVVAFSVVSVNPNGADGPTSVHSGLELLTGGLRQWGLAGRTV